MNLLIKQLDSAARHTTSRQEFLKILGIGILAIVGIWSVLGNLQNATQPIPELGQRAAEYSSSSHGR